MTTLPPDDDSPIYQFDTGATFAPQFLHKDGTPVSLIGATISMKMQLAGPQDVVSDPIGTIITCTGTWTIDDAANGKAHYQYQSADVANPGTWNRYITITISGLPVHADMKPLTILPSI